MAIDKKMVKFCEVVEKAIADYSKIHFPNLPYETKVEFTKGKKYFKVFKVDTQKSVYCFVDMDGYIWKPAGWKAPTKNFHRGNVNTVIDKGLPDSNVFGFTSVVR